MPLRPEELNLAVEHLRVALANKKGRLGRDLVYSDKRDALRTFKKHYPEMSAEQLHHIMRLADSAPP